MSDQKTPTRHSVLLSGEHVSGCEGCEFDAADQKPSSFDSLLELREKVGAEKFDAAIEELYRRESCREKLERMTAFLIGLAVVLGSAAGIVTYIYMVVNR